MRSPAALIEKYGIQMRFLQALHFYEKLGHETGGFLRAMLENNLVETLGRADGEALAQLKCIVNYIMMEMQGNCHGDKKTVEDWLARYRLQALGVNHEYIRFSEHWFTPGERKDCFCDICMKVFTTEKYTRIDRAGLPFLILHTTCAPPGAMKQEAM